MKDKNSKKLKEKILSLANLCLRTNLEGVSVWVRRTSSIGCDTWVMPRQRFRCLSVECMHICCLEEHRL